MKYGVIGGEFKIELKENEERGMTSEKLFSSGRSALYAILCNIKKADENTVVLVPNYLCASITHTIEDVELEYAFYGVNEQLRPDMDCIIDVVQKRHCAVLFINYFGIVDMGEEVQMLKRKYPFVTVIIDNVQSYYSPICEAADYTFNSFRKWFPVPDGAQVFASHSVEYPIDKNTFAKYKLAGNLLKNYSQDIDEDVMLELIGRGEDELDKSYNCVCSEFTRRRWNALDFLEMREARQKNAAMIHRELTRMQVPHLYDKNKVPLFIPMFIDKGRKDIRQYMFERKIFLPIHWPVESIAYNGENVIYEKELSLICDHRYSVEDIEYMMETLKECM